MRKTIIILSFLIIVLFSLPIIMGGVIKSNFTATIDKYSTIGGYQLKLDNYKFGYLHSTALIELTSNNPNLEKLKIDHLFLHVKISHGPVFFTDDVFSKRHLNLGQGKIESNITQTISGKSPLFTSNIKFSLLGEINGIIELLPMKADADNLSLHHDMLTFNVQSSDRYRIIELGMFIPSLSFETPQFQLADTNSRFNLLLNFNKHSGWIIKQFSSHVAYLKLINQNQLRKFSNLDILITQNLKSHQRLSLIINFVLNGLTINQDNYQKINFNTTAKNLYPLAWQQLQHYSNLNQYTLNELVNLIGHGATISIKGKMLTPLGQHLNIKGKITLPALPKDASPNNLMLNSAYLLKLANAKVKAVIPEQTFKNLLFLVNHALLIEKAATSGQFITLNEINTKSQQQVNSQLSDWQSRHLVILRDKVFHFDLDYLEGKLTINGNHL